VKRIAVIVRCAEPARVAEALRAAVGLTLRGGRLQVVLADEAVPHAAGRALGALTAFGHQVDRGEAAIAAALRDADAVEVWS
jgi:hypothetical protein